MASMGLQPTSREKKENTSRMFSLARKYSSAAAIAEREGQISHTRLGKHYQFSESKSMQYCLSTFFFFFSLLLSSLS